MFRITRDEERRQQEIQEIEEIFGFEEQIVPVWGYSDLKGPAEHILETLNQHRPGEFSELKNQLYFFILRLEEESELQGELY